MKRRALLLAVSLLAAVPAFAGDLGQTLVTVGAWSQGVPACVDCHGPDLGGVPDATPAIAGLPAAAIRSTLHALQENPPGTGSVAIMQKVSSGLSAEDIDAVAAYIASLAPGTRPAMLRPAHDDGYHAVPQSPSAFTPPPLAALPTGPEGEVVWQGLQLMLHTRANAGAYVGNDLECVDCHVDQGRRADSAPMWGAYVIYPKYREKTHSVQTLTARVQDCFRYSMNGKPPAADSPEIGALVAYYHWLATGLPVGIAAQGAGYPKLVAPASPPDREHGATLYAARCSLCHGAGGEGRSARGEQVFPPLWGPRSYNWGAGMERLGNAASFIQANMPYGSGGTLSLQEAWDLAAFIDSQPRPQDPRYTGSVEETRRLYHGQDSYYGQTVDGHLLGGADPH